MKKDYYSSSETMRQAKAAFDKAFAYNIKMRELEEQQQPFNSVFVPNPVGEIIIGNN